MKIQRKKRHSANVPQNLKDTVVGNVSRLLFQTAKQKLQSIATPLTFINYLSTARTCSPSPANILHPRLSSSILSLFSFGSLKSLGTSPTNSPLVSFRTRRAWERLVGARLSRFPCNRNDSERFFFFFFLW